MVDQDVRRGPKLGRRPHAEVERALGLVELPPQEAKVERPHWVAVLCCHRLWFADALIRVDAPVHQTFYQLDCALQNPYLLCLVRAMKIEDPGLAMMQIDRDRLCSSDWEHWFQVDLNGFFYSDETIIDPTLPIHVFPKCCLCS